MARANRAFMHRATRWLADQGVRQFLDIGTGIPTEPNLHQIAQRTAPNARIVYCDNDPIVLAQASAMYKARGMTLRPCSRDELTVFFDGLELVEPGVSRRLAPGARRDHRRTRGRVDSRLRRRGPQALTRAVTGVLTAC